jgi:hypothetical protein
LPEDCSGEAPASPWRIGASGGYSIATIDFGDGERDVDIATVLVTGSRRLGDRFGLDVAAGAVVAGAVELEPGGEVSPGVALAIGGSVLAVYETDRRPFVLGTLGLAGFRAPARADDGERHPLTALDLRAGALVGKTFGPVTPYLAARGFAGPVSWRFAGEDRVGGDIHHYTLGAGVTARIERVTIGGEVMPVGERSAALTASVGL